MSYDSKYRSALGHYDRGTMINDRGSMSATLHISGENAELMDENAVGASIARLNQLALNSVSPQLEWWQHFTRMSGQRAAPLPPCRSWWGQQFDAALREKCMDGLFRNDLFFTIVWHPEETVGGVMKGLTNWLPFGSKPDGIPRAARDFVRDFEDKVDTTLTAFAGLGVKRLGAEPRDGVWFSEIAEAMHVVMNGYWKPIPLPSGRSRIGRQIVPNRPVFGRLREMELVGDHGKRFIGLAGLLAYPNKTHPGMYERVRRAKFPLVVTNSSVFTQTRKAVDQLNAQFRRFGATGDASKKQAAQIAQSEQDLNSGDYAWVSHHLSLAVHATSIDELDRNMPAAMEMLSLQGAQIQRYDAGTMKAAYFAQDPYNAKWRVKREGISTVDFAGLAALNNVPTGDRGSRWGAPIMYLRTTANTIYADNFHIIGDPTIPAEDVGSFFHLGGMGSGKTSLGTEKLVCAERVGADAIVFDKDCGTAPTILAEDGEYFVMESGEPSGWAPLRALTNAPDDIQHLHVLIAGLIESDSRGPMETGDDTRLGDVIAAQMCLPRQIRGLGGIQPLLDNSSENSSGARLHKWVRGQRLGWAFDGLEDRFDVFVHRLGIDMTALLKNDIVCEPMLAHAFYRIQKRIYMKKPLIMLLEECHATLKRERLVKEFNDHSMTIRKNEGIIGFITQNGWNLLQSAMAETIKQNVHTKVFFGDTGANEATLIDGFSLTPKEFHIVKYILPTMRHAFLKKMPGRSLICRNDLSAIGGKVAVLSGRRATYDMALLLRAKYGTEARLWTPHFERLAPLVVKDPHLDIEDLVEGRTRHVKESLAA